MSPHRKRPKRGHPQQHHSSDRSCPPSRADQLQKPCIQNLSNELLLLIFQKVGEKDICALSRTCKQFYWLSNDTQLWKKLYQDVFEYDLPLFRSSPSEFKFCDDVSQNANENPWKKSFTQLYQGSHVYPSLSRLRQRKASSHQYIRCFSSINSAMRRAKHNDAAPYIFLHTGVYKTYVLIDKNVYIIGAGRGSFKDDVIIDGVVMFRDGARDAYLGHLTTYRGIILVGSSSPVNPVIEHCNIRAHSSFGDGIVVQHVEANPTIRHCSITGNRVGILFEYASGRVEDNCIHDNTRCGIEVQSGNLIITRNNIHGHMRRVGNNGSFGILIKCDRRIRGVIPFKEEVVIENNEIHHNAVNICFSGTSSHHVIRNKILGAMQNAILVRGPSNVLIEHNSFYDNPMPDILLLHKSHLQVKYNFFDRSPDVAVGVLRNATVSMGKNYF